MAIAYPDLAQELIALLAEDQAQVRAFSRQFFWQASATDDAQVTQQQLRHDTRLRANRALAILETIGLPLYLILLPKQPRRCLFWRHTLP